MTTTKLQEQPPQPVEEMSKQQRHLFHVKAYQQRNPDKCTEKCRRYRNKLRTEFPEKYEKLLQKKRDYYQNVVKPRNKKTKDIKTKSVLVKLDE